MNLCLETKGTKLEIENTGLCNKDRIRGGQ